MSISNKKSEQAAGTLSAIAAEQIQPFGSGCLWPEVLLFDQGWLRPEELENAAKNCPCAGCGPKTPEAS